MLIDFLVESSGLDVSRCYIVSNAKRDPDLVRFKVVVFGFDVVALRFVESGQALIRIG